MRDFYQHLYDDTDYNWKDSNRCPGIRWYPHYKKWIKDPVFDLGCGNGGTVEFLRKEGFVANGMDWVDLKNEMLVGDITKPQLLICNTAICIDVFEHVDDKGVEGIMNNMNQATHKIINISNTPSPVEGKELHINIKPFDEWKKILEKKFKICEEIEVRKGNMLYLCK
jgi:hypothetical protein